MSINFQNVTPEYLEDQEKLLCAKHAINNILQENKLIWDPARSLLVNKETKLNSKKSIMLKNTQLNLHKFCLSYPVRLAQQSGQTLENASKTLTKMDKCDMDRGNIPFEALNFILRDLGFRTEREARLESIEKFKYPNLLGVIFNLGGGHYTAISKFMKSCKSWTRNETRRLTSVSYSYLDSFPKASLKCLSTAELEPFLKALPISSIMYVFYNPTSYDAVSVRRAFALNKATGGKRKTLKQRK